MRLGLSLTQKVLLLVALPLVFELIFVGTLVALQIEVETEARRSLHAQRIADAINQLTRDVYDLASAGRNVKALKSDFFTNEYPQTEKKIRLHLDQLSELTRGDPYEHTVVANSRKGAEAALQIAAKLKQAYVNGDVMQLATQVKQINKELRASMQQVLSSDLVFLNDKMIATTGQSPEVQEAFRQKIHIVLIVGVCLNVIFSVILALFLVREIISRVHLIADNARRFAAQKELNTPIGGNDEIAQLDRVFHEMSSALAVSNGRQTAILNNARDMICSLDQSGRFVALNPASFTVLGYTAEELGAFRYINMIPTHLQKDTKESLRQCVDSGIPQSFETQMIRKDATTIDTLWSAQWSNSEQAIFCVIHDISERKQWERMKQELVAMITHDLRTPLSVVGHFVEMVEIGLVGELPEKGLKMLGVAQHSLKNMNQLINDLLDLEKIRAGMLTLEKSQCSIKKILQQSADDLEEWSRVKTIEMSVSGDDFELFIDESRFNRVIVNLLSNAVKFSPRGSTIELHSQLSHGMAMITVTDQGRGIPAEKLSTIFERFLQVDAEDASEKGGSGLGLAICKSIIEVHGGQISAQSEIGKGTTFTIALPLTGDDK
ncbi:hypothetical protein BH10CYA1_BH10CYA1_61140 [soil metagenome]